MKNRQTRTIETRFTPNPPQKREALELVLRAIHSVCTDKNHITVRRKDNEKSA